MTLQVLKSQISDTYESDVEAYRQTLLEHRFTEGEPTPTAPLLIEQAVVRVPGEPGYPDEFVLDYHIVDDTPPPAPEPTEEELRARAVMKIRQWEQEEINKIIPANKMRLAEMDYQRAMMTIEDDRSQDQSDLITRHQNAMKSIEDIRYMAAIREAEL